MRRIAWLVPLILVWVACGGGDGTQQPPGPRKWTVFIYGAADNNLSFSLVRDYQEMLKARLGSDIHVVFMADWDASAKLSSTESFPAGSEWYYIHDANGTTTADLVKTDPEQSLDDPNVLKAAIVEAFTSYKSERHALVLWDHGGAWKAGFGGDTQNGTNASPSGMSVDQLHTAIRGALDQLGIAKLDLFAFDTCLMGGVEEIYAFRDVTLAYTANAEIDYGDGLDYQAFLTTVSGSGNMAATQIAATEVGEWDAHHRSSTPSDTLLRSHVAIDTSKVDAFAAAMAGLSTTLASGEVAGTTVARRVYGTLPAYSSDLEQNVSDATGSLRDVGQFLTEAGQEPGLAANAQAARQALDAMTLGTSLGSLRTTAGQTAVHIELPLAKELSADYVGAYQDLSGGWATGAMWGSALDWLFGERDTTGPAFTHQVVLGTPPAIELSPADEDVAQADVNLAVFESQTSVLLYGLVGSGAVQPGTIYTFPFSGNAWTIGGTHSLFIVPWIPVGSSSLVLAAWGVLSEPGGGQWEARLLFMDGDSEANVVVVYENGRGITVTTGQLARDYPGIAFTPVLPALDLQSGTVAARAGENLLISQTSAFPMAFSNLGMGTYVLLQTVKDVWGNTTDDIDQIEIQ